MRELSTVNMGRDDAESIQWNWKPPKGGSRRGGREYKESIQWNWKCEQPSQVEYQPKPESIQWNWKVDLALAAVVAIPWPWIHSMELKAGGMGVEEWNIAVSRIHSMELKEVSGRVVEFGRDLVRNPFNGIERNICIEFHSTTKANTGIHSMELKVGGTGGSRTSYWIWNPFNGIESRQLTGTRIF